jgi:hypothetical protein
MASKARKPILTEEHKERLEQCFQQVRDRKLRQWYEEAHSENPQTRIVAQARLQLQIWLRQKRTEIAIVKEHRDACKANGDVDGLVAARKKLKHAHFAMAMHVKMSVEGTPTSTASKACRKWAERTYTLEEILDSPDSDKRTEFGVNRDSLLALTTNEEIAEGITLEKDIEDVDSDLKSMQLEDGGVAMISNDKFEATPDPTAIWTQHALHMQERYRRTNLPDFAIETKLACHKKLFDQHVDRKHQLQKAVESTYDLDAANAQHHDRDGINKTWNPVLVTTTFCEHSLWELTSPMLWRYFEGGLSWDYPQWVPKGVMRIQTASTSSKIYIDFGVRTFSTQSLVIPATISTRTLTFPVQCHQTGADVDIEITFLVRGFVKVCLPVLTVILPDLGCKNLPVTFVELTGLWLGPVE